MKQTNTLSILIVEDEAIVRETLVEMITYQGHITEWAMDGLVGKNTLLKKKFDAAFVDMRMPGIDGLTLLKWAKQEHLGIPIIIMTGHGDDDSRDEAMQSGAYAFLCKPFSLKDIKQLITELQALPIL